MNNIAKKPYEISIWEDILEKIEVTDPVTGYVTIKQYYKEKKLAVIGSNTMTANTRAHSPVFKRNTNGSFSLNFTMYNRFFDETVQDYVTNPFLGLLINERKIKLHYDNEWYDFVIKNIQESSDKKTFDYTAQSLFINELSKTGFDLVLDTDLENNHGTVTQLADTILKESDWQVDKSKSDIIQQKNEEPLYEIKLNTSITATNSEDSSDILTIPNGAIIYGFYSSISEEKSFFQFLYREDGIYITDDDRVITNSKEYYMDRVAYENDSGFPKPTFALYCSFSDKFRGKRLVRKETTVYDKTIDKYVSLYKNSSGEDIYGFTETEYISPTILKNYVTNAENFVSVDGWSAPVGSNVIDYTYPPISSVVDMATTNFIPFMKLKFASLSANIYNSGFYNNRSSIGSFAENEKYVFRLRYGRGADGSKPVKVPVSEGLRARISEYTLEEGSYKILDTFFDFSTDMIEEAIEDGQEYPYQYNIASCKKALTYKDFLDKKIGLFFYAKDNVDLYYSIEEVQVFPYKTDANDKMVVPGTAPAARIKTIYYYYKPDPSITDKNEISYLYKGVEPSDQFESQFDESFEKVRSISVSESNRFNMIQDLCEIFECWADFTVEHNPDTGEILIDEDYRQKKWVSFRKFIGKDNYSGFKYGINLKTIQRTLDSDQIVSKIVVKQNSNQYGTGGFCTIARAKDNTIKENFLYNFKHYIQQGLLDYTQVNNDFYLDAGGYLGYYVKLRNLNKDRDSYIEEQTKITPTISQLSAAVQTYQIALNEAEENLLNQKQELKRYCGIDFEQFINPNASAAIKNRLNDTVVKKHITAIVTYQSSISRFNALLVQSKANLLEYEGKLENIKKYLDDIADKKESLNKLFYKKYSRFIQEGSWISEDYVDDNLYYLDAESTLYTSASPQVSYTIDVIELSQIPGFENYDFSLGDKTYMEDTEFFGWVVKDGMKTPYQEEIIISEISTNLDSPELNKIVVQNYKTQFEDLFQRITATTQAVQYKSGDYNRAANVVTPDGDIKTQTLQNSFTNNSIIISNAKDQSVVWNDNGLLITSLSKPNEIVRLVSGGIFLSSNGGDTWNAGITGNGINANHITSGQIDASKINILSGAFSAFRWDEKGINAYKFNRNAQGEAEFFNFGQFVRFDQYGMYGVRGDEDFTPSDESEIKEKADFGLTWSGFFLRSNHKNVPLADNGYISIDSDEDFRVIDGTDTTRIKLGRLGQNYYGLRFFDNTGATVMETNDIGQLFLKQKMLVGPDISDSYRYRSQLGIIESYKEDGTATEVDSEKIYSKIFSVKNIANEETIAFYDNGLLEAKDVDIEGKITATSGKIGNMTIEDINNIGNLNKGITLESKEGTFFKTSSEGTSPASLTLSVRLNNLKVAADTAFTWYGSSDFDTWTTLATSGQTYSFVYDDHKADFDKNGLFFTKVTCTADDGITYTSYLTLTDVKDGSQGTVGPTSYVHIKYSAHPDGTDFSDTPNDYMGIYTGPSETAPTDKTAYKWSKIVGDSGEGADSYVINVNQERILKFNSIAEEGVISTSFSPPRLDISVQKQIDGVITKLNTDTYTLEFEVRDDTQANGWFSIDFLKETNFLVPDDIKSKWILDLASLNGTGAESGTDLSKLKQILLEKETAIRINLKHPVTDEVIAIRPVEVTFGSNQDMATFALNANGINASIQNSKLEFNSNGLTITNGGINILGLSGEQVFGADTDGNLVLKGIIYASSGSFNGTVTATDGIFNGTINAIDGTLKDLSVNGKITIGDIVINGTDSEDEKKGIYTTSYINDANFGFFISENGTIVANEIILGSSAEVAKYIRIGNNSWIFNPSAYDTISKEIKDSIKLESGTFIVVNKTTQDENISEPAILIKEDGIMRIGSPSHGIIFNGNDEYIQTTTYNNNIGWRIDNDAAVFNNIVARGSIKSSVLEYSEVQSVGGVLIVRPSSIIKTASKNSIDNNIYVTVENRNGFMNGDYCKIDLGGGLNQNVYEIELPEGIYGIDEGISSGNSEDGALIKLKNSNDITDANILLGKPLVDFGKTGDIGIGINSSNNGSIITPRSISIFETSSNLTRTNLIDLNPRIILGQIPDSNIYGNLRGKFGLYADNVLLKGSMIAKGENYSSGINTESEAMEKNDNFENKGKILLWAGAENDSVAAIENAKFRVDTYGNLYAGSGYFQGTIITDATITAAEIKTAVLTGYAKNSSGDYKEAALEIRDTNTGIRFTKDGQEKMVLYEDKFTLNMDFEIGDAFKILSNSSLVAPVSYIYNSKINIEDAVIIEPNRFGFSKDGISSDISGIKYTGYLTYNKGIEIHDLADGEKILAKFSKQATEINNNLDIKQEITIGKIVEYKQVLNTSGSIVGYDLYVRS